MQQETQDQAKNIAINDYISSVYGASKLQFGTTILLPEFVEESKGVWVASDTLVRETSKEGTGFIRLAAIELGDNFKLNVLKTNSFQPDNNLHQLLTAMGLGAGSVLPGKLVIEEALVPFSITNPDRDMKYAGTTGIPCSVEGNPIYRRVKHTMNAAATHILIAHDNREEIRNVQPVNAPVKAQSKGLAGAAARRTVKA